MVQQLNTVMSTQDACQQVGLARATYYRSQQVANPQLKRPRRSARRFSDAERADILAVLNSERFMDWPPRKFGPNYWMNGDICVIGARCTAFCRRISRYRSVDSNVRTHRTELLACAPNELWSWDITTLKGPVKGTYFKLYVILDVFSRYVVGWTIAPYESAALAKDLVTTTLARQNVNPDALKLHSDRGSVMVSKTYVQLLADLGVEGSYSRPYQSNDNPYSESHFRTMKYHRSYVPRFGALEDARRWARQFFHWYNHGFYHSEIALMSPVTVHYGQVNEVWQARQQVMDAAYARDPEKFIGGAPKVPKPRRKVWINRPHGESDAVADQADS